MIIETKTTYVSDDGLRFSDIEACKKHAETKAVWKAMLRSKIGEYDDSELLLGGHALLSALPFESPWMSSHGACLVMVTDVRRENGVVQFQLADENCTPYENGSIWEPATAFYKEWPT